MKSKISDNQEILELNEIFLKVYFPWKPHVQIHMMKSRKSTNNSVKKTHLRRGFVVSGYSSPQHFNTLETVTGKS